MKSAQDSIERITKIGVNGPIDTVTILNHVDSHNLGDVSMTYMIIEFLKKVLSPETIYVLSFDVSKSSTMKELVKSEDVIFVSSPARTSKGDLLHMVWEMLEFLLWACSLRISKSKLFDVRKNRLACTALGNANLVVVMGGDNFSDTYGYRPLFAQLYNILLSLILRKKIAILGTSIGPFKSKLLRNIAYTVLRKVDHIVVRDRISSTYLEEAKFKNYEFIPDIAFDLPIREDDSYASIFRSGDNRYVAVGTNAWVAKQLGEEQYASILAGVCDRLKEKYGLSTIFICHGLAGGLSDETVARKVLAGMKEKESALIIHEFNPMKLKYVISNVELIISSRMHPIIHALSVRTPIIGINYNAKIREVMRLFNKENWVIDYPELKKLPEVVDAFFAMKSRDENFYEMETISVTKRYTQFLERYQRNIS